MYKLYFLLKSSFFCASSFIIIFFSSPSHIYIHFSERSLYLECFRKVFFVFLAVVLNGTFILSLYRVQLFDSAFEFAFTSLLARLLTNCVSFLFLLFSAWIRCWGQSANTITKRIMAIMTFQLVNNGDALRCACVNARCPYVCVCLLECECDHVPVPEPSSASSDLYFPIAPACISVHPLQRLLCLFLGRQHLALSKICSRVLGASMAQGNSNSNSSGGNNKLLQIFLRAAY